MFSISELLSYIPNMKFMHEGLACLKTKIICSNILYFKGKNFRGQKLSRFSRYLDNFAKVYTLEILNHQNAKVFSPKIIGILFWYDFFTIFLVFFDLFSLKKTKIFWKARKFFSTKFFPKIERRESFCQKFRVF